MGKIIILDENTSNQIAAGEVIERPASIIKELIENSIDAGAKNIKVEIVKGGITLIRIADDGEGIASDDVEMAFERHGTSKIRSAKDLTDISTMGFRGEALASIASVADVTVTTRTEEEEAGTLLHIKGGNIIEKKNIAKEVGTTFVIKSIFYNTPARYKFLKNDMTEARYCHEMINKIALANPHIAFTLISNHVEILKTRGDGELVNTIYSIYGKETVQSLLEVDYEFNNMRMTGFVGRPIIARGNRGNQSLFINHRNIKSIEVTRAIENAFESTLMKGKFPFFVLNVELSNSLVDVNVHPQKLEVRFSNINEVFSMVYRGIKMVIDDSNTIYEEKKYAPPEKQESSMPFVREPVTTYHPTNQQKTDFHEQMKLIKEQFSGSEPVMTTKSITETDSEIKNESFIGAYTIVGQLFDTYIVLQREDDILLMDQHACHERITYENLLAKYLDKQINKQMLMVPVEVRLTSSELLEVHEHKEKLSMLGFEYDQFSSNSILIRSVPTDIKSENAEDVFKSAVDHIAEDDKETLYMMACKNAIKANMKLSHQEINEMIRQLEKMTNPYNCPHGRPTMAKMTKYELEKKFKRIV
ncbi:MAG: DNA mismatch repair endonuclease MutL [Clostridia bacterium]|nr:DNA mismatch repair endonuclease MutL [Clostridia bacterium]